MTVKAQGAAIFAGTQRLISRPAALSASPFLTPLPERLPMEDPHGEQPGASDPLVQQTRACPPVVYLTHSIGIGLPNNEVAWFLEKGTVLPAIGRRTFGTEFEVRQEQAGDVLKLPVLEGESPRADRNCVIGLLKVTAQQVREHLPAWAEVGITIALEVEITLTLDESRILTTSAFIEVLGVEFQEVVQLGQQQTIDANLLQASLEEEKRRLARLRGKSNPAPDPGSEPERLVQQVEVALAAARLQPEALDTADRLLLDLKIALDDLEG
jgi:molecular chaperone DnaK